MPQVQSAGAPQLSLAERARHISELEEEENKDEWDIDIEYYLSQQVLS